MFNFFSVKFTLAGILKFVLLSLKTSKGTHIQEIVSSNSNEYLL